MLTDKDRNTAWEIIKSLSLPDDFGPIGEDAWFETDGVSNQISGIGDFFVTYGVTKMVIVPDELSFVIKIPFNGHWVEEYNDDNEVFSSFVPYYFATSESFYDNCELTDEYNDDYCYDEFQKTNFIKIQGYSNFIPDMMYVGQIDGHSVYIQEKVRPYGEVSNITPSKVSLEEAKNMLTHGFKTDWLAQVLDIFGKDCWKNFIDHCEICISDIHTGNYGYRENGSPVIFDISGFRDEY